MARRRRGQFPEPKKENGQWKIRYWTDEAQPDGSLRRVRKTKCLGRFNEITATQAKKEAWRFLEPINDVHEGIEHSGKTMQDLVKGWRQAVGPALKYSTQCSYEWAFQRISPAFGKFPLPAIGKADIQAFLTASAKRLSGESLRDLKARLAGLFSVAEEWTWIQPGTNPIRGKFRLPPCDPVRERRILSVGAFQKLVAALGQPYSTLVVLAVLAGLRRGELATLRWNDNAEHGRLVVDEAVYRGKLGSPKTPKSRRSVCIGPATQRTIDCWRKVARFTGPDDFMFGIRKNTPIDLHNAVARHVKPAALDWGFQPSRGTI